LSDNELGDLNIRFPCPLILDFELATFDKAPDVAFVKVYYFKTAGESL